MSVCVTVNVSAGISFATNLASNGVPPVTNETALASSAWSLPERGRRKLSSKPGSVRAMLWAVAVMLASSLCRATRTAARLDVPAFFSPLPAACVPASAPPLGASVAMKANAFTAGPPAVKSAKWATPNSLTR